MILMLITNAPRLINYELNRSDEVHCFSSASPFLTRHCSFCFVLPESQNLNIYPVGQASWFDRDFEKC